MSILNGNKPSAAFLIDTIAAEIADRIRRSGVVRCDLEEMNAVKEAARGRAYSSAVLPFDPKTIASDRELAEALAAGKDRVHWLRAKRDVVETRLINAREQTARMPAPRTSLASLIVSGTGVFTLCFSPTIYGVFFAGMEDAVLAWVLSVVIGGAVGGFLSLLLLNSEEE
jgi:hypothetical protein